MDEELVLIYNAESYMDYLWISSLLDESNIKFLTQHPPLQNVFGQRIVDSYTTPIKIYVFEKDVDTVLQLLNEAKADTKYYGTE